jgi:hypothetical protein
MEILCFPLSFLYSRFITLINKIPAPGKGILSFRISQQKSQSWYIFFNIQKAIITNSDSVATLLKNDYSNTATTEKQELTFQESESYKLFRLMNLHQ